MVTRTEQVGRTLGAVAMLPTHAIYDTLSDIIAQKAAHSISQVTVKHKISALDTMTMQHRMTLYALADEQLNVHERDIIEQLIAVVQATANHLMLLTVAPEIKLDMLRHAQIAVMMDYAALIT
jgi:hypothetical protein